jgi:hypothetical protein
MILVLTPAAFVFSKPPFSPRTSALSARRHRPRRRRSVADHQCADTARAIDARPGRHDGTCAE